MYSRGEPNSNISSAAFMCSKRHFLLARSKPLPTGTRSGYHCRTSTSDRAFQAALSTALVMAGARSSSVVNRFLSRPALHYVGAISYSLYLFHFVVPGLGFSGRFDVFDRAAAAAYALNFLFTL